MMINLFVIVQDIICLLKLQSGKKKYCARKAENVLMTLPVLLQ